jgi:hypothetical protein
VKRISFKIPAAIFAVAVIAGMTACSGSSEQEGLPDEQVARVQHAISLAEFDTEASSDPELAAVVELAKEYADNDELLRAGTVEDDEGVRLIYAAVYDPFFEDTVVAVRHCQGSDCVHAVQFEVGGPDEIEWEDEGGNLIPVRTMRAPFGLRLIDPADPDGTARLAPVPALASLSEQVAGAQGQLGASTDVGLKATPNDPDRKIRISSVFGQYFTWQGPNFNDLVASAQAGGFPNAEAVYNVKEEDVDSALSTLGPKDAFVFLTHGDESKSSGRVVGMSVSADYWGSKHYPGERMRQQLASNDSGGPGIVFLSGCKTADLIPIFDNGQRVVLGFNAKIMPGQAAKAMRAFFDALSAGKTVREAIAAANAEIKTSGLALTSNQTSKLDEKLVSVGGGNCATEIAKNWQGQLTVTQGTSRVPVGAQQTLGCDGFTITLGDSPGCDGCWTKLQYQNRPQEGCMMNNTVALTQFDDGPFIAVSLNLVSSDRLSVTVEGEDSGGDTFIREGVLSPCP